ncbi:MAG: T9SS type A sorting domain-containing protein [Saprospiraceae bacterium]|nr:T9SS type A sorting domain-containing protein [Saprospiraceae bacterium]
MIDLPKYFKLNLFFAFFAFPSLLFSQSWFTEDKEWKYNVTTGFYLPDYGIHTTKVTGDTIVLGKNCKKMTWYPVTSDPFDYFVYQDGRKVYYFMNDENTFELIYDFSLGVGDILQSANVAGKVEAIGTIEIEGYPKNYQIVDYISGAYKFMFVEELGIIGDPLNYNVKTCGQLIHTKLCQGFVDGWDYFFACYNDKNVSYDPKSNCATSNIPLTEKIPFSIFPNPTLGALILTTDDDALRFEIIDLMGKIVKRNLHSGMNDVSELSGGIYIFNGIDAGGKSKNIKLFIQK